MPTEIPPGTISAQALPIPDPPTVPYTLPSSATASTSGLSLFVPTDIPSCILWLDTSDLSTLTLSGSDVLQWRDKISSVAFDSFVASPTFLTDFYNGQNIVVFAGAQSLDNTTLSFPSTAYTVLAIGNLTSASSYKRLINGGGGNGDGVLFLGSLDNSYASFTGAGGGWNDTTANSPLTNIQSTYSILEMVVSGSTLTPYINGTIQSTKNGSTASFSGLNIGGFFAGESSQTWIGYCGDILVFNTALTDSQRQKMEGYLAWKWGIQSSLPSNHPYRNRAPDTLPPILENIYKPAGINNSTWIPSLLPNLRLWLDANATSTLSLTGSDVTEWRDRSDSGNNTTGSFGNPQYNLNLLNGKPGVTMNGSSSYFELPAIVTEDWSIFLLISTVATGSSGSQWYSGNGIFDAEFVGTVADFGTSLNDAYFSVGVGNPPTGDDTITSTTPINTGNGVICEFLRTSSSGVFENFVNGEIQGKFVGATGTRSDVTRMTLGALQTLASYFNGSIFEVVVYSTPLSSEDRQRIEGYLGWKWKIQSSLDSNHPYRFYPPPPVPPIFTFTTFTYTGDVQSYTVPSGVTSLLVYLWGAGGGGGGSTGVGASSGGAGAYVAGRLAVTPGEKLDIIVGFGGSPNAPAGTLDQGGGGGAGDPSDNCSSGGGRSAIQRAGEDIVVAGGGSGGGWSVGAAATWFGTSNPGTSYTGGNGGGGGTQTEGGAAGFVDGYNPSTAGSKGQGGNGGGYASGGGGGWYGGGGGGVSAGNGGTGGAGSSYIDLLTSATGEDGGVPTAPATSSPFYSNGAARGGQVGDTTGGNGLVAIRY